jgi:hypothetical protein
MNNNEENEIPLFEEIRIQVEILMPILSTLKIEFGEEKAYSIIRKALCPHIRGVYHNIGKRKFGNPFKKWNDVWDEIRPRIGQNVERDFIINDNNSRQYDVKGCKFADYFRKIKEPELGKILMCDFDYYIAEIGEPIVHLTRTKTIMEGADCCDFRYTFNHDKEIE